MTYTVSQFDTIIGIAQKFGVSVDTLMSYNNLTPNSFLFPGMIIIIPPVTLVSPIAPVNRTYIVRRADTVWSIARRFGVSV